MKAFFLSLFVFTSFNIFSAPLEVGKEAPEIKITKWLKKGPVKLADGKDKNIFVVEFWATLHPSCRMAIPHLSRLQKKYKDKGLVVIGITKEKPATVEPFVKEQADMDYHVGIDIEGNTYDTYMEGVRGIPNAFIVNKEGTIAWSGHPLGMDAVLEKIMNNTFNIEAHKKIAELQKLLQTQMEKRDMQSASKTAQMILMIEPDNDMAMQVALYLFAEQKQPHAAIAFLDQLISFHPAKSRPYIAKLGLLNDLRDIKGIESLAKQYIEQFQDNPSKLNSIAWILLEDIPFGTQPLGEALDAAEKAVNLTPGSDKMLKAAHIDTLARCYYSIGRLDKAILEQKKAINLLKGTEEETIFKRTLDFYRKAQELGKD